MSNAELTRTKCLAQQIIECFDDGVLLVNQEWRITSITPLCLSMICSNEAWIGKSLWDILPVNTPYSHSNVKNIQAAFNNLQCFQFDCFYAHVDHRWFRFSLRPATGGVTVFVRDVTDQHVMAAKHVREREDAIQAVVLLLAHQINNPLQALTNLIVLARKLCSEPGVQDSLDSAEDQVLRVGMATNKALECRAKSDGAT